tara:strand:+ start:1019 stop:1921 length:903 start_codon:yes stop_codon:yes gene_type:complete
MESLKQKVFLIGSNGQIGKAFLEEDNKKFNLVFSTRDSLDLLNTSKIADAIKVENPDIIINCSGFTDVELAETTAGKVETLNSEVPRILAETASSLDSLLIHFSTDYVFDGRKEGQYIEEDKPNPLSNYGRTKLEGDRNISQFGKKYFIFRTCWIYSQFNKNFLKTLVNLMTNKTEIRVIIDQIGTPTSATFISRNVYRILGQIKNMENIPYGIYNLRPKGSASWFEFAEQVLSLLKTINRDKVLTERIVPIISSAWEGKAQRPKNSVLDISKIHSNFDIETLSWDEYVLGELKKIIKNN